MSNESSENIINPDAQPLGKQNVKKDFAYYKQVLSYMGADISIQVLCLPKSVENTLVREGIVRVYDLFNRDLTEIKGLGSARLDLLASRLNEFFSVSL